MNSDPTTRFSSRVENYVKYRPSYPPVIVEMLTRECGLTKDSTVADVGSGTGKLAELLLLNGNAIFGVEPNREMRQAGEQLLQAYARFTSVDGTAEATGLEAKSVDFVIAGQAFHWFDMEASRREFTRILKPAGWTVIVWNERQLDSTPFLLAYEAILSTFGTDYQQVTNRNFDLQAMAQFFGESPFKLEVFPSLQVFNLESLKGRLLSTSYTPEPGHPDYEPMLRELERIYRENQVNGEVVFFYDTKVYYGQLE